MNIRCLSVICALALCTAAPAVDVAVDLSTTYQTIDGFGGYGARYPFWAVDQRDTARIWTPAWCDSLINDLGLTIIRGELPSWEFEAVNDNDDPFVTAWERFNITGDDQVLKQMHYLKAMTDAGVDKVLVSVWSPPAWMKDNGTVNWGGHLLPSMLNEFAEMCYAYITLLRDRFGVNVYALSVQNEPELSTGYASCIVDYDEMADRVLAVKNYFRERGCTTKVLAPEKIMGRDNAGWAGMMWYLDSIYGRPGGLEAIDILGIHYPYGSTMGVAVTDPYEDFAWRYTFIDTAYGWTKHGKPLWVTEESSDGTDWQAGLFHAKTIFNLLTYGHGTASIYWQIGSAAHPDEPPLLTDGRPPILYYSAKQIYRFIRPGATVVRATSSDLTRVGPIAVTHPEQNYTTIVLINDSQNAETINLSGAGLPSTWQVYQSTETLHCERIADLSSASFQVPAQSITTLCSNVPQTVAARQPEHRRAAAPLPRRSSAQSVVFTLRGQKLHRATFARGVFCESPASDRSASTRVRLNVR
jgi:glucuronoarabinoxylan endo-1,4-beta-xylanase